MTQRQGNANALYVHSANFMQRIQDELSLYVDIISFVDNLRDGELDEMIIDYNNFMLRFGNKEKPENMANSIKLMWRIHLLHPVVYLQDCLKHFHHIIDPQHHIFNFQSHTHSGSMAITSIATNHNNDNDNDNRTKFTDLNLKQSLLNQTCFMRNIVNDIGFYQNENNIKQTISEYIEFLTLIRNTKQTMIPSVAIDVVWHTHLLHPIIYYTESHILADTLVDHNDFLKDESPEKYFRDWLNTKKEWNQTFGHQKASQIYVAGRDYEENESNTTKNNQSKTSPLPLMTLLLLSISGVFIYSFWNSLEYDAHRRRLASVESGGAIAVIMGILVVLISICILLKVKVYDQMCQIEGCLVALDDYQIYYHSAKSFPDGLRAPTDDKNAEGTLNESSIIYKYIGPSDSKIVDLKFNKNIDNKKKKKKHWKMIYKKQQNVTICIIYSIPLSLYYHTAYTQWVWTEFEEKASFLVDRFMAEIPNSFSLYEEDYDVEDDQNINEMPLYILSIRCKTIFVKLLTTFNRKSCWLNVKNCCQRKVSKMKQEILRRQQLVTGDINKRLRDDEREGKAEKKLLLIGGAGAGKAAIFKQLRIIHSENSQQYRLQFKEQIYRQIIQQMRLCLQAIDEYKDIELSQGLGKGQEAAKQLENLKSMELTVSVANVITALWKESAVQWVYSQRAALFAFIEDSSQYFWDEIQRISHEEYVPTDRDILMLRCRATGISEEHYDIKESRFHVINVCGQRNERRHWIHCYEKVSAVLFVASLSSYNEVLSADGTKNAMHATIELFTEICNSKWFRKAEFILLLNKDDLFREKLQSQISLSSCFSDEAGWRGKPWEGPDYKAIAEDADADKQHYDQCYDAAIRFIQDAFITVNQLPNRVIFCHIMCAVDHDTVQKVFWDIQNIVIRTNLRRGGLMCGGFSEPSIKMPSIKMPKIKMPKIGKKKQIEMEQLEFKEYDDSAVYRPTAATMDKSAEMVAIDGDIVDDFKIRFDYEPEPEPQIHAAPMEEDLFSMDDGFEEIERKKLREEKMRRKLMKKAVKPRSKQKMKKKEKKKSRRRESKRDDLGDAEDELDQEMADNEQGFGRDLDVGDVDFKPMAGVEEEDIKQRLEMFEEEMKQRLADLKRAESSDGEEEEEEEEDDESERSEDSQQMLKIKSRSISESAESAETTGEEEEEKELEKATEAEKVEQERKEKETLQKQRHEMELQTKMKQTRIGEILKKINKKIADWKAARKLIDNVFADLENMFYLLSELLLIIEVQSLEHRDQKWKIVLINSLKILITPLTYLLVVIVAICVILPSCFFLLIVRMSKVETTSKNVGIREAALKLETKCQRFMRVLNQLLRSLFMFIFLVIYPIFIIYFIIPFYEQNESVIIWFISSYLFIILLLQLFGTWRGVKSFEERKKLKPNEQRYNPQKFKLNLGSILAILLLFYEVFQLSIFAYQTTTDGEEIDDTQTEATSFSADSLSFIDSQKIIKFTNYLIRVCYLSLDFVEYNQLEYYTYFSVVGVGLLVFFFVYRFIYELKVYAKLKWKENKPKEAREVYFHSFVGTIIYGHGKLKHVNKWNAKIISLLADSFFLGICQKIILILCCDDNQFLRIDPNRKCWDADHKLYACVALILLGFYIPICAMIAPMFQEDFEFDEKEEEEEDHEKKEEKAKKRCFCCKKKEEEEEEEKEEEEGEPSAFKQFVSFSNTIAYVAPYMSAFTVMQCFMLISSEFVSKGGEYGTIMSQSIAMIGLLWFTISWSFHDLNKYGLTQNEPAFPFGISVIKILAFFCGFIGCILEILRFNKIIDIVLELFLLFVLIVMFSIIFGIVFLKYHTFFNPLDDDLDIGVMVKFNKMAKSMKIIDLDPNKERIKPLLLKEKNKETAVDEKIIIPWQ